MRLVYKTYDDGEVSLTETTDDGTPIKQLLGSRKTAGNRMSLYIEAICDNNVNGVDYLLGALSSLKEEAEKKREEFAKKSRKNAKKQQGD